MRAALLIAVLLAGGTLAALWATGGFDTLAAWARGEQREAQNAMAGGLRAIKAGEPGALAALLGLCFAYGVFHAAGPGHGKVLIGGYGVGSAVRVGPMVGIALVSSLAQATTAVLLVYAGVFVFDWTRERMTGLADGLLDAASYGAIALIGAWLALRGLRRLMALRGEHGQGHHERHLDGGPGQVQDGRNLHVHDNRGHRAHDHGHDHGHGHAHDHGHGHAHDHGNGHAHGHAHDHACGHAHGPTVEEVARVRTLRDAAVLVAGVAIRPCTGALFLLILTWRMGIDAAGILGAYAMGLGTASVTVAVAVASVMMRNGLTLSLADRPAARVALPVLELAAGAVIATVALQVLARTL